LGCREAKLVETTGNPIVYGEYDASAQNTLIVYMMYDTQPFTNEVWTYPPLEGKLVEIEPLGVCMIGRGAFNTKGPLAAFLNAVESILAIEKNLPVNLKFVAEGEEELGSKHLPEFIQRYGQSLKDADAVFFPFASQDVKGKVKIYLGVKGIVYLELECSGGAWGKGPTQFDIHSSNKAWADSPTWRLIHALSTMTSADGNRVLIDGFYENVAPPTEEDLELVGKLASSFDEVAIKEAEKIYRFIDDLHGRDLVLKYLYSTTLNVDGIWSGYTGPGTKTVLPHRATAKLDVRLIPDQSPDEIIPKIRRHLDNHRYNDIIISPLPGQYDWSKTSANQPIIRALKRTYEALGYEPEIWPHLAGSAPFCLFNKNPLQLPFAMGGLGHGGRAHSPDEYLVVRGKGKIAGLASLEESYARILYDFARYYGNRDAT
jgi:acetylornithine deacetylase/succinyl-diaminopimelate desuccinylase-like protein